MHGLGRLGECGSDPCIGVAALGMEALRTERIRGAHCVSFLEIIYWQFGLLHLQLMESAMEGSWAIR